MRNGDTVITLQKHTASMYINLIRQIGMCRIPELRPIAVKVGLDSNVAQLGDGVEESTSEFISNLTSAVYGYAGGEDLIAVQVDFSNSLLISDLARKGISIISADYQEVLHSINRKTVVVYFRYAYGMHTKDENSQFLIDHGVEMSGTVAFNSRHCPLKYFTQKEIGSTGDTVQYNLIVTTNLSIQPDQLLSEAVQILKSDIQGLVDIN